MINDRIERRAKIKEAHDLVFAKLKEKFNSRAFPMAEIDKRILECQKIESHHYNENRDKHNTMKIKLYEPHYEFFGIDWSYEYCKDCNKVLNRRGVLTDQIDNTAYMRKFDSDSVRPIEDKDLVSIFDGGLEVNIYD